MISPGSLRTGEFNLIYTPTWLYLAAEKMDNGINSRGCRNNNEVRPLFS